MPGDDRTTLKAEVSCPFESAHTRLRQAHDLWHRTAASYGVPEEFVLNLNQLIVTLRQVTFMLQNKKEKIADFDAWYEKGWRERMKADPIMAWLNDARTKVEHIGDLEGLLRVERRWVSSDLPDHELTEVCAHGYRRTVPMPEILREQLVPQCGNRGKDALVFGTGTAEPFQAERLYRDAAHYWHRAGLRERLRLHQARHTYASFMIAAGVNALALAAFIGHSSITVTFDLYGHLMPGAETDGAALLDAYLAT